MTGLVRRTLGGAIEIRTAFEPEPWTAFADAGQLEAAILNLVINARDAMPKGGVLTLETANRVVDETYAEDGETLAPGRYVAISVSDTGTGMAPEVAKRAFEPFFTTKETGKGTGLGLSMVYGFARQSGGYAKLYSEPGHGTTVRLLLPAAPGAEADPGAASAEAMPRARAGEVILLVEDTGALRRLVARQLEDLGYVVRAVADGPSALAALPELPRLDLLLTDVVMPGGMSGVEIAEAVRARRPGVEVLFMSGFAEGTIEATSHGALRGRLLNKPFRHPELARRVRAAIDGA
jgi:CheY-like chemotaxis protein